MEITSAIIVLFAINGGAGCPVSQVRSRHERSADDHRKDKPESSILRDSKAVFLLTDVSHGFNRVTGPSMLLYGLLSLECKDTRRKTVVISN